ncbi:MAG: prepilin-type N-terminal cleavage/methylation domain-containing protein [Actinobacteria bacterium]|nr:prepilin-type N-terminal cleavage/methylation domain-containing protein [Actinomycetota bacterium]
MRMTDERGFSLVELMVAVLLLSVLGVGFYQVMFSSVRGSNDAADIAEVAEEARLAFNRMIRDTREATRLVAADADSYRMWTDFNGDGVVQDDEYEYIEYSYDADANEIVLTALAGPPAGDPDLITGSETVLPGTPPETLAANIREVPTKDVFSYASNFLDFDTDADGQVSVFELGGAVNPPANETLEGVEFGYISDVNYAFRVSVDGDSRTFYGQAQIRNRRYSNL